MVDEFRNYAGNITSGKIEILQMPTLMTSGVKQVRISSSSYEEIKVAAFSASTPDNNVSYNLDIGDRGDFEVGVGKLDCSGSIEISQDYDMWENIINGYEMLLYDTNERLVYKSGPIAATNSDPTATSMTMRDGTVITPSMFGLVPSTMTGAAWIPTDVIAGRVFAPSDFPVFNIKVTINPNTTIEHISFYYHVTFVQMRENKNRAIPTYTIDFKAWERVTTSAALSKGA